MKLARLALVLPLAFLVACGDEDPAELCADVCDRIGECDGDTDAAVNQCNRGCERSIAQIEDTNCDDAAIAYYECLGDVKEVCDGIPETTCASEAEAITTCRATYCENNPSDSRCL